METPAPSTIKGRMLHAYDSNPFENAEIEDDKIPNLTFQGYSRTPHAARMLTTATPSSIVKTAKKPTLL